VVISLSDGVPPLRLMFLAFGFSVTFHDEVISVPNSAFSGRPVLLVGVSHCICALPLAHVIETMRPLPLETIAGVPPYVCGASIVRGVPTPVVDLGMVLGKGVGTNGRFVSLRLSDRQVVFSVRDVLGVQRLDDSQIEDLPPLLQEATNETIESIGTLDRQMLFVLRASWMLPDSIWRTLANKGNS
jgi:purine-binding chemotaxis protein CheW